MMRIKYNWIWVLILLLKPNLGLTTVGGPQEIQLLGYKEQERRVYWLTYFRDETGRLPQLSYIDFSTGQPFKPVVDTLWMNAIEPYHMEELGSRLSTFRSQLIPLEDDMSDSLAVTARILGVSDYVVNKRFPPVKRFEMEIVLRSGLLKGTQKVTAYINKRIGATQWYRIPNEPYGIAIFSFTGIPWESGYSKDIVVVLKPETQD